MKTTLDIDDNLLIKAKILAVEEKKSLTSLIEEGLRLRLRRSSPTVERKRPRLPVYKGKGGLVEGVNPLSNRSLFEAADDDT